MMLFKNREHLLYYLLQGHAHLSKKDFGFFNNMQYIVKTNKRVTTNQHKLFDKLIVKYQRQLKKLGHNIQELLDLSWDVTVVDSAQEYLDASISIEDSQIQIRSPFNTRFVTKFRQVPDNNFVWNKDKKIYAAPYSTYSLKIAIGAVKEHFDTIKYSYDVQNLLSQVEGYDGCNWEPTLKRVNGFYYISAINEPLYNAIKDVTLSDEPKTLFKLSHYGVKIDELICDDPLKVFASSFHIDGDLNLFDTITEWLELLNVDHVFTAREIIYNKQISNEIKQTLLKHGITCSPAGSTDHKEGVLLKTSSTPPNCDMRKICKVIHLTNSRPVNLK